MGWIVPFGIGLSVGACMGLFIMGLLAGGSYDRGRQDERWAQRFKAHDHNGHEGGL